MRFSQAKYQDTFRRVFKFGEYNNNSDFFIELDYFINRDCFASGVNDSFALSKALSVSLEAENGERIFRNFSEAALAAISARNYRLVVEKIEVANFDEDIYKVTETYGYAPSAVFHLHDQEKLTFAGYTTNNPGSNTYTYDTNLPELAGNNVTIHGANKGDMFYFKRPYQTSPDYPAPGSKIAWPFTSAVTTVQDDSGLAAGPAFRSDYEIRVDSVWAFRSANFNELANPLYWWTMPEICLYRRIVQPVVQETNVDIVIQYFTAKPALVPRSKLMTAGGAETNDANKGMPANLWTDTAAGVSGVWVVEDSQIERDGNLWKRSTKTSAPLYLTPDADISPEVPAYAYRVFLNGTEFCALPDTIYADGSYVSYIGLKISPNISESLSGQTFPYKIKYTQTVQGATTTTVVKVGVLAFDYGDTNQWFDVQGYQTISATGISDSYATQGAIDFVSNYTRYLSEFLDAHGEPSEQYAYSMSDNGTVVKSGTAFYNTDTCKWEDLPAES